MNNNVIGLDIAKNIFHPFALGVDGKTIKKKLKRSELLAFFANYPASIIGTEACGSSNHWARVLTKLGHEVILLNACFVKNYVVGNKTDFNDAETIHKAGTRPNKRVVAIKTVAQQDIQLDHAVVTGNSQSLNSVVYQVIGLLFKWLNRRSQRKGYKWKGFMELLKCFGITKPRMLHAL